MVITQNEREVLEIVDFPFIAKLECSGYDAENFYMQIEYVKGMMFSAVLIELDILTIEQTKFYGAQILMMLHYMHEHYIIYRDLKPDNIICDARGYLKLIDMGTAKIFHTNSDMTTAEESSLSDNPERTFSNVGTPHYTAPEVSRGTGYNYSADYWSYGI